MANNSPQTELTLRQENIAARNSSRDKEK